MKKIVNKMLWLPLSLFIFGVYAIQRGFATFAKAPDFGIPNMIDALGIYFIVMSLVVLIGGYLLDNFNSRIIVLIGTILAVIGLIALPANPFVWAVIFGLAAALFKLAPFSSPLKIYDNNESLRIAPQAAAKNLGGAAFILFLGAFLVSLGWVTTSILLASFVGLVGFTCFYMMPDDKIKGWKFDIFIKLAKDFKFWQFMVYMFFMSGLYYMAIYGYYPALLKAGFPKTSALTILGISYILAGACRFLWGYLGQYFRLPLMWIGTFGMAVCIYFTNYAVIPSLILFSFASAIHTPNYWAYAKEKWGPTYISTVVALGSVAMYIGAGVMYGKWS